MTYTSTHVMVELANPFLVCDTCRKQVTAYHESEKCSPGCETPAFNFPCEDSLGITSLCPSWSPVDGCNCPKILGEVSHPSVEEMK